MSRYAITVTSNGRSDPDAIIGYDPPLRTFFLQAFPDESGDDLALWLGTSDREYETLDALHAAVRSRGFDVMPLPDDIIARLSADVAAGAHRPPHEGPLVGLPATSAVEVTQKKRPAPDDLRSGPLLLPVLIATFERHPMPPASQ
jgi:hypothetical protein